MTSVDRPRSSSDPAARTVPEVALRQGGVFTRQQALDEGWTPRQVRRRTESGSWRRLAGKALVHRAQEPDALAWAWAVGVTWPDAVVSHRTAGLLHGFPLPRTDAGVPEVAHAIAPRGRRRAFAIRAHEVPFGADDVCFLEDLAVTSARRTAVDCLADATSEDALRLWAWLSTRKILTRAELSAEVLARTGRHGTPTLVRLLGTISTGAVSVAELRLHRLLRRAGLTGWTANTEIQVGGRVIAVADVLFPAERLVLEVDGWSSHGTREAFVADHRRQNALHRAGYLVLRFTWDDLVERPDEVVAEILDGLARQRAALPR